MSGWRPFEESLGEEERQAYNREAFKLHFGRPPGAVAHITAAHAPDKANATGSTAPFSPFPSFPVTEAALVGGKGPGGTRYKHFHNYPLLGISSEGPFPVPTPEVT